MHLGALVISCRGVRAAELDAGLHIQFDKTRMLYNVLTVKQVLKVPSRRTDHQLRSRNMYKLIEEQV
jgi:hypothetical protein